MKCGFCGAELDVKGRVMRKDVCPQCRRDLHCCLQCRFHDPTCHNECREPKADMVRDRDKANFCDYFEYKGQTVAGSPTKDQAKKALDDLFKK